MLIEIKFILNLMNNIFKTKFHT